MHLGILHSWVCKKLESCGVPQQAARIPQFEGSVLGINACAFYNVPTTLTLKRSQSFMQIECREEQKMEAQQLPDS
eukprot:1149576-Pelagomonas_calceolata.AAC.1